MSRRSIGSKSHIITRVRARESLLFEREQQIRPHDRHLDDFHEKIYFHEIDGRDKVVQRLQLPLVGFVAIAGFVGNMLQNIDRTVVSSGAAVFWAALAVAIMALGGAAGFFIVSVTGKLYHYLPLPKDWAKHKADCIELFRHYDEAERLVSAALTRHLVGIYESCGSVNGTINARKASYVFWLIRCLVVASISTVIAFGVFFTAKLDKNLSRIVQRVEIVNPSTIRYSEMTSQKPPPAPSPPPVREIKEDRSTPNRPPPAPKPGL